MNVFATNKEMQVQLARVSGFCGDDGKFGVSGAIALAQEAALSEPGKVYLIGELVHNQHVTNWLEKSYQLKIVSKLEEVPKKSIVIVKAHGAPPSFFAQAQEKELRLVDATCPMVKAAQELVKALAAQGKEIIFVASQKNHDEAISVSQQVENGVRVVTLDELDQLNIKTPEKTVVLTQTTLSILETQEKFAALQKKYPQLIIRPHMCPATTARQKAVLELAKTADVLIVVGAAHSSNSKRLQEVAANTGKPSYIVDNVTELKQEWFEDNIFQVGVIAGASTPSWITDEVVKKLESWS
ncbi:MAG: 4-hydroxy-3-methylbut-2-enyl diphosphate reductase [bacterium]|nr:4-hydroxy-3-methylbut-2-enyl diphosphate reductase [bacterium]